MLAYALTLAIRPRTQRTRPAEASRLLAALGDEELTLAQLADRLEWEQRPLLRHVVYLIETRELEEDLDVDTGLWRYRRTVALHDGEPLIALPATERLAAIDAAEPQRRKR